MPPSEPAYETPEMERPASSSPTQTELEQELPGGSQHGKRDAFAALRHRDYRLYAFGGTVAALCGQMMDVAVGWEIYERTHSELALGLVGLVAALPVVLLVLFTGQAADRFNRRHVLLVATAVVALASFGLCWNSARGGPLAWTYGFLGLAGTARAFEGPARGAFLNQIVPPEALANAVTWNSSRWQFASMIGPAVGGALIWHFGRAAPIYGLECVAITVNWASVYLIRGRKQQRAQAEPAIQSLLAGWRFVQQNNLILATITLDMFAVFLGGATTLLPVFAKDILRVDAAGLGWLRAAPAFGALMMGWALAVLPPLRQSGKVLLWAVIGFGISTIFFGISRSFYFSMAMLAIGGALDCISVVIRHTLVQVLTPDSMRGRVGAINSLFIGTSNELGGFESGVTARLLGPTLSVVVGGLGTIASVLGIGSRWPQIRQLDRIDTLRAKES